MLQKFIKMSLADGLTPERHTELLSLLESVPAIANALAKGGWLCGGFPRHLLLNIPIKNYFSQKEKGRPGDIDIFFSSVEDANCASKFEAHKMDLQESFGGFATESSVKFMQETVHVQFVNHPDKVYRSVETALESFDFLNCMVAITHEGLIFAEGWQEIENAKLLKVCNNNSPFLGSRILKYLTQRGLSNVSSDSQELLSAWFCSASNEDFEGSSLKHRSGIQYAVRQLETCGHVKREDLLFFIGKYQEHVREAAYGDTKVFDWALRRIGTTKRISCE